MTEITHRQYNPVYVANKLTMFVGDAVSVLNRRFAEADVSNWFKAGGNLYPSYYQANTFHYQTGGWLSTESADVYEIQTESLFYGRQDAMQRTTLLPISQYIASRGGTTAHSEMRLLEIACGTGRFHTYIKDNFPSMRTVASDLSPYYLEAARENMAYWKNLRVGAKADLGGTDGTGTDFYQCAAEAIPAPDASFDIVACVYLFHEIPEEARSAVAREVYRVLKPGGLFVLTDSAQLGDRPQWDRNMGAFGSFNEPWYKNYIACDLGGLMADAGFRPGTKWVASASKTLSFMKPATGPAQMGAGLHTSASADLN